MTGIRGKLLDSGPFRIGFVGATGVLLALGLALAVGSIAEPLTLIALALFIALGLYPVVRWLEGRKLPKAAAMILVMLGFIALATGLGFLVVPVVVDQGTQIITELPSSLEALQKADWFVAVNSLTNGGAEALVDWAQKELADPQFWLTISGGALRVGLGVINGVFGAVFVIVLTLYFVASMETIKTGFFQLVPASKREGFVEIAEEIIASVGGYLGGMFVLAVINAIFTFVILTIAGVPFAGLLAALALPITFIPMVGSVISSILSTSVAFLTSPTAGLVTGIALLVYMQIEAYWMTPKIVGKAVNIPGSLVLIGAMIGGSLAGLLGVMVACPLAAAILLILKRVVIPRQAAA